MLCACSNPYTDYFRKNKTLHPELMEIQKKECLKLGFKNGSTGLAECRKDMAQDWKNNLEARRRDIRPTFGINYGIGSRW